MRIIIHAMHTNRVFVNLNIVVIKSADSDALVLALDYFPQIGLIDQIWIERVLGLITAPTNLCRYVPVLKLCSSLIKFFLSTGY